MRVVTSRNQKPQGKSASGQEQGTYVLGVDGGATTAKAALLKVLPDGSVRLLASATGAGVNPHRVGEDMARENLREVIKEVVGEHRVDSVAVGMSGLVEFAREEIAALYPGIPARVTSDVSLPVLGEHDREGHGVVSLVSGTGSAAVRMNPGEDIATSRAGGWGWFLGDEGSGTDLGKKAVQAALRDLEGGPPSAITGLLADHYGCARDVLAGKIFSNVYGMETPAAAVSPLAPLVFQAKDNGDSVAHAICEEAALDLARAVAQLYHDGDTIVVTGSVGSALRAHLEPHLEELAGGEGRVTFYENALAAACVASARLAEMRVSSESVQSELNGEGPVHAIQSSRRRGSSERDGITV